MADKTKQKAVYNGMKLINGRLHILIDWYPGGPMPRSLSHPGLYSKDGNWHWGPEAFEAGYDVAFAILKHAHRTYPVAKELANRYAVAYAQDVVDKLPLDAPPAAQDGAPTPLWQISQDEVQDWMTKHVGTIERVYEELAKIS